MVSGYSLRCIRTRPTNHIPRQMNVGLHPIEWDFSQLFFLFLLQCPPFVIPHGACTNLKEAAFGQNVLLSRRSRSFLTFGFLQQEELNDSARYPTDQPGNVLCTAGC